MSKEYLNFKGKIIPEFEYVNLNSKESINFNVTVIIPSETEIGVYPVDIRGKSSLSDDKMFFDNLDHENELSFQIIVVSNNSNDNYRQANKPNWKVGNIWEYIIKVNDKSFRHIMQGTLIDEITDNTTINVNGKNKDALKVNFNFNINFKFEPSLKSFYNISNMHIEGDSFYQTSNLALIMDERKSEMRVKDYDFEFNYESEWKTIYDPPDYLDDWPINSGEIWSVESSARQETKIHLFAGYYETFEETWDENEIYICLGYKNITTEAGTYESFPILKLDGIIKYKYDDWENKENLIDSNSRGIGFGVDEGFEIFYYSPGVGWDLKQVTYQKINNNNYKSWNERYEWKESMIIELVSFSHETTCHDFDQDDIPDFWEKKYCLNESNNDIDNDGFTNLEEYEYHTLPRDPNVYPIYKEVPANRTPKNNNTEDSILGLGKIRNIDLAYIYILIIAIVIIILILFAVFVRRKRKGKETQMPQDNGIESRVTSSSDTGIIKSISTQIPIINSQRSQVNTFQNKSSYIPKTLTEPQLKLPISINYPLESQKGQLFEQTKIQTEIQQQGSNQVQQPQIQPTIQLQQPPQKRCSICGQALTYYSQNNKYYCHQCKKYE